MPVRGFDTVVLLFWVAPQSRFFRSWRRSGAGLCGGEGACHVGGKAMIRDQQIIRCAALILGEGRPPFVCHGVCPRQALAQRAFAIGNRLRLQPNSDCAMTPSNADALPGP